MLRELVENTAYMALVEKIVHAKPRFDALAITDWQPVTDRKIDQRVPFADEVAVKLFIPHASAERVIAEFGSDVERGTEALRIIGAVPVALRRRAIGASSRHVVRIEAGRRAHHCPLQVCIDAFDPSACIG